MIRRIILALFGLGIVFAFWQVPTNSPNVNGIVGGITDRAETIREWLTFEDGNINLGIDVNQPPPLEIDFTLPEYDPTTIDFDPQLLIDAAASIQTINFNEEAPYNRGDWYHWENYEKSCWTVREEVLYREAVKTETLTLLDADKIPTDSKAEACYISGGLWVDPYTGEEFYNPEDLDIDHMIALSYANKGGGSSWADDKKREYANSLDYENHLIAVSASANRSKSDKGPSEWVPENEEYHCEYATSWTTVANNWELSLTSADKAKIIGMLDSCQ